MRAASEAVEEGLLDGTVDVYEGGVCAWEQEGSGSDDDRPLSVPFSLFTPIPTLSSPPCVASSAQSSVGLMGTPLFRLFSCIRCVV